MATKPYEITDIDKKQPAVIQSLKGGESPFSAREVSFLQASEAAKKGEWRLAVWCPDTSTASKRAKDLNARACIGAAVQPELPKKEEPGSPVQQMVDFKVESAKDPKKAKEIKAAGQNSYLVTWTIDIEAETPEQAAMEAMSIQQDVDSEADHFEVKNKKTGKVSRINAKTAVMNVDASRKNVKAAGPMEVVFNEDGTYHPFQDHGEAARFLKKKQAEEPDENWQMGVRKDGQNYAKDDAPYFGEDATEEVRQWVLNDEDLYREGCRARDGKTLERAVRYLMEDDKDIRVDFNDVDWDQVYEDVFEDEDEDEEADEEEGESWDTAEVSRWIMNDEPLYNAGRRARNGSTLEQAVRPLMEGNKNIRVDLNDVDWDQVYEDAFGGDEEVTAKLKAKAARIFANRKKFPGRYHRMLAARKS